MLSKKDNPTLAVIGGGLAGIAAAESAVRRGWNVELFEWSRVLGGRVASQFDPKARCWIDNGQHVFLGCCTEQIALNQRLGVADLFDRYDTVSFATSENRRWTLSASAFLPPRWQLVPSFLKNPFLSFRDRLATGLLLRKLAKLHRDFSKIDESALQKPPFFAGDDENAIANRPGKPFFSKQETFGRWLRRENASEASIEHFWSPLIYSTLSDTVDGVCLFAAVKVIVQAFMSGRDAMALYVPKCPLREIYNLEAQRKLSQLGVNIQLMSRVERLICEPVKNSASPISDSGHHAFAKIQSLVLADGTERRFDSFILAIPAYRIWKLLESSQLKPLADSFGVDRYELGSITAVHLWFDQPILPKSQRQIAILGEPGQWIFHGQHALSDQLRENQRGYYHQVIISASHRLLSEEELTSRGKQVLIERVLEQLRTIFPETCSGKNGAVLLHAKTTTVFDAVFSPTPEVYRFRPPQNTAIVNLAIAGDWTQTNWPATMEGAIRSGLSAVERLEREKKD
ncbi:MAG: FAD-dependent oxidoreductase [Planctomycetaceae bacterium]|nr:FAD-dependent oxidoreductase [Planctomycetaceae bacterium]